jgi:hypothetical protein
MASTSEARANGQRAISFAVLVQFLLELVRGQFHGQVHIQFRGGQIGMVKREETYVEASQLPVSDLEAVRMMETGRTIAAAS